LSGENDHSSGSRTIPLAQLNPLFNPLLGDNMGRWAEVYFTNPPERREQAVLELLQELEAERSRHDEEANGASESSLGSAPVKSAARIRCDSCGRENPVSNKYCGMCGAGLGEARAQSIFGNNDSDAALRGQEWPRHTTANDSHTQDRLGEEEPIETSREAHYREQYEKQADEESRNDSYPVPREFGRPSNGNGLSLFQASQETDSDERLDWSYEPEPSRPYRYYIGAVLAVIILVLGYMAWRGTQGSPNAHEVSAPPPTAASDTAAAPEPAASPANTATEPPVQSPPPDVAAHPSQPAEAQKTAVETRSRHEDVAKTPPTPAAYSPAGEQTQPGAGNGGEELAVAQRYLNGAGGQGRDTAEGAKWLWKSVAKHNGQATVLLADLYLKGSGVSKNCDQARVLLDSAARKGVAGAGERLRNLPAFGCQ
jgi:hypothetical protein